MRTLYRASRVHTFGHPPQAEWILVDGRHVQRVGRGDPPAADRVVELPQATIIPGFIDSHVHLTSTGQSLHDRDVAATTSKAELLRIARGRAEAASGVVHLQGFDETKWDAPALPSLEELDALTANPLVIRRADGHLCLVNSAAIAAARVGNLEGCEKDGRGEPTGRLTQEANRQAGRWAAEALDDHGIEELQLAACAEAAQRGITTVHEMSMPLESGYRDLEVLLSHRSRLPVDTVVIPATTDVARVLDMRLTAIGGDLPLDGSVGARTAAFSAPYADRDSEGVTYLADTELLEFFRDGHDAGLQVGVHAIGDRAIEQAIFTWESVYRSLDSRERRHFRARRHRIEHFELPTTGQIERAAALGLAISVQPAFDAEWGRPGGLYETALGRDRAAAMNPFHSYLERGIALGAGSDAPVTPLDPWAAIRAMESHNQPDQRLGRMDALRLHITGGARLARQEEKKGTLEPGFHADFTVWEFDPCEDGPEGRPAPLLTVSLGREVFAR